jgi:hypothetical protein
VAAIIDSERAIQIGVDVDARAGVTASAWAGEELEEAPIERHCVIVLDGALVFEGANAVEVRARRRRLPRRLGVRGGLGEAGIVARKKSVEHALGLGERAGLGEAEFDHQAVLEGTEEALDAPFGLGRMGPDPADAELTEGPADLGLAGDAAELLLQGEREAGIRAKDAMAIGVDRAGEAIASGEAAEEEEVAVGILLRAEDAVEDLAGRIIDRAVQDEAGAPVLEPGVVAAVHLDQEARLWHALSPAAMPGWAPLTGAADTGRAEAPLDGGAREMEILAFRQELGEMAIVTPRVGGAGKGQEAGLERFGETARAGPPPVPMGESGEAASAECGEEAADVASREAQQPGRVRGGETAMLDLGEDMGTMLLGLGQGDCLPVHSPRVTESLSSWGVTESLSSYTHAARALKAQPLLAYGSGSG